MNAVSLEAIVECAEHFDETDDLRPEWLRALDTDPTSVYYRFFHEFARRFRPGVVLEIGTCEGKSAAHLAAGHAEGLVITLDVKPEAKRCADSLMLPNLVALVCDSVEAPGRLKWMPTIDLLFIDGEHEIGQVSREYAAYRGYVRDGGLIFFDDIRINAGMEAFWRSLPDPKVELGRLHYTGFGAAIVRGSA